MTSDLRSGTVVLLIRGMASAVLGATVVTLLVWRVRRRALLASGLAAATCLAIGAVAWVTLDEHSVAEPSFDGLLVSAPAVVGVRHDLGELGLVLCEVETTLRAV